MLNKILGAVRFMEYYSVCLNKKFKLEVNVNCKIHTAWIVFLTFT